jgi:fucose permease
MLFSSGLGSVLSGLIMKGKRPGAKFIVIIMALILIMLAFVIKAQPPILSSFVEGTIRFRIFISLLFLFPLGFVMGMPFPVAMTLASTRFKEHTPWFWAVNGATSVVASVLSACISITWGFTATLTVGFAAYLMASVFLYLLYSLYCRGGVE